MKTIIARFTELKENVAGTADSEFEDLDYNKVDKALKTVGVSLKDTAGQFRNLDDVFLELSAKWNTLDRNSQRYIATIAAGSRQQSRFIAMMENYERTMELIETAQDSAGRSNEQFSKYADTIEYKLNQLSNSWEQFRTNLVNSDGYKTVIDFLTTILDKFENFDLSKLLTSVLTIAPAMSYVGKSVYKTLKDSASGISSLKSSAIGTINDRANSISNSIVGGYADKKKDKASLEVTNAEKALNKEIENQEKIQEEINQKKKQQLELTKKIAVAEKKRAEANKQAEYHSEEAQIAKNKLNGLAKVKKGDSKQKRKYNEDFLIHNAEKELQKTISTEASVELNLLSKEAEAAQEDFDKLEAQAEQYGENIERSRERLDEARKDAERINANADEIEKKRTELTAGALKSAAAAAMVAASVGIATGDVNSAMNAMLATVATSAVSLAGEFAKVAKAAYKGGASIGTSISEGLAATGPGLVILAILASIAALYKLGSYINELSAKNHKSLEVQAEEIKENLANAEEQKRQARASANESKKSVESAKELKEEFAQLSQKQIKTTEEQEHYNELVNQIQSDFPEIVTYYNEMTGELRVQNDLWDSIIEKSQTLAKKDAAKAYAASTSAIELEKDLKEIEFLIKEKQYNEINSLVSRIKYAEQEHITEDGKLDRDAVMNTYWYYSSNTDEKAIKEILTTAGYTEDQIGDYENYSELFSELYINQDKVLTTYLDLETERYENEKQLLEERKSLLEKENKNAFVQYGVDTGKSYAYGDFIYDLNEEKKLMSEIEDVIISLRDAPAPWLSSIDELSTFYKAIGNGLGVEPSNVKNILRDSGLFEDVDLDDEGEEIEDIENFAQKAGEAIRQYLIQKTFEDAEVTLTKEEEQTIDEYAEKMADASFSDLEKLKDSYINSFSSEETKKVANVQINQAKAEIKKLQNSLSSIFSEGLTKDWSKTTLQNFSDSYKIFAEKTSMAAANAIFSTAGQVSQQKNLDPKAIAALTSVQWDSINLSNKNEIKKNTIDTLKQYMTGREAEELWQAFYDLARGVDVTSILINEDTLAEVTAVVEESLDNYVEGFGKLSSIIEDQLVEGTISYSQSRTVKEALEKVGLDASKYLFTNANGDYVLDTEGLVHAFQDVDEIQANLIEEAQAEVDFKKAQIDAQIDILDEKQTELNLNDKANEQEAKKLQLMAEQLKIMQAKGEVEGIDETLTTAEEIYTGGWKVTLDKKVIKERKEELNRQKLQLDKDFQDWLQNSGLDKDIQAYINEIAQQYSDSLEKAAESTSKAQQKAEKYKEALEKIADAEKDVVEKQKELNEAMYGTENRQSSLDPLSNYETALDRIQKKIQKASDSLNDLSETDNVSELIDQYISGSHEEAVMKQAENSVIRDSIKNYREILDKEFAGLYYQAGDRLGVNFDALKGMPDDLQEYAEGLVSKINELYDQIDDNNDDLLAREKEFLELRKKALDDYVSLEDQVVNTLKEKYEEEIENAENKYQALEEADNAYLEALEDALKKQRELRDQEKSMNDLAKKEKKLSLMQRDTSGINRAEIIQLEEEIQTDRDKLLDDTVDKTLEALKEMYELQQESREIELEYQKAMIDNAALVKEANAIIEGWNSADDAVAWFYENTKDISEWSAAKLEQETLSWKDLYEAKTLYMETSQADFNGALITTEDEIKNAITSTGETLTNEATRSLAEIKKKVSDAIEKAQEALDDAIAKLEKTKVDAEVKNPDKTYSKDGINTESFYDVKYSDGNNTYTRIMNGSDLMQMSLDGSLNNSTMTLYKGNTSSLATFTGYSERINNNTNSNTSQSNISNKDQNNLISNNNNSSSIQVAFGVNNTEKPHYLATGSDHMSLFLAPVEDQLIEQVTNEITKEDKNLTGIAKETRLQSLLKSRYYVYDKNEHSFIRDKNGQLGNVDLKAFTNGELGPNQIIAYYDKNGQFHFEQGAISQLISPKSSIAYKKGGLVNFTGPAWVDGTKTKPEAFLSAEDTKRIGEASQLLADLPILNSTSKAESFVSSNSAGDTSIEININVEEIGNDYDVDRMIDRVQQNIIDASRPIGTPIILRKS